MSGRRVLAVAGRIVRQLVRDQRALALILVAPVVIMGLLAVVLGSEGRRPRVAFRASGAAVLFLDELEGQVESADEEDAGLEVVDLPEGISPEQAVAQGLADAVLVLPGSFLADRASGKPSRLDLYVEGADPMRTAAIFSRFRKAVPDSLGGLPRLLPDDCADHCGDTIPDSPPKIELHRRYGQDIDEQMDFFIPVLPPFFAFFFVFILSGMSFLRERVGGTAERLLASPLRRSELVTGYVLGFLPAALVQSGVVILFARYALGGPWGGVTMVITVVLLALVAECLGLFVSAFARSEFQVFQFIPVVIVPQILLCGMIWPIDDFPGWLQPLAWAMPVTYSVEAVRDAAIRGLGLAAVWPDLLALAGFAVLGAGLAALSVRRVLR